MTIDVLPDRIPLRLKERDILTIMHGVLEGQRSSAGPWRSGTSS